MSYPAFENRWLGKRIDTDGTPAGAVYQCVDLIKQYFKEEFAIDYAAFGNAIDYWRNTKPQILAKFDKVAGSVAQQADVVVVMPTATNSAGHIGIATGQITPTTVEILEQNGGSGSGNGTGTNAIRRRFIARSSVAGLLRPKGVNTVSDTADNYFVEACAEGLLDRTASGDTNLLNNVGRPKTDALDTIRFYPEAQALRQRARDYATVKAENDQLKAQVTDLQKQVAAGGGGFTQTDRDTLNWIQKAIAAIFKI